MEYIVELKDITKNFPGVKALDGVSFNLQSGEVVALLGENGAGKSTLMKVLSGVHQRDGGEMYVFSEKIDDLTPKLAQKLGIAIIHQELNMCKHLTVAENIFLGRELFKGIQLDNKKMNEEAKKILDELDVQIPPTTVVDDLPVSKQQMVEIAKALSTNAKILIMDEPTSALTSKEIDELFRIIKKLRSDGVGIIYISHRLEELEHIVDRVFIMRDGKYITSSNFEDISMDKIIAAMVGREIKNKFPKIECERGKKVFEVKNLNAGRMVRDIDFELYEGEIVGIAGLMGAGRTETTRAIFGVDHKTSGEIYLNGELVNIKSPEDAIKAGIVLAPEDRKKDGLCVELDVYDNVTLPNLDLLSNKMGVVNNKKGHEMVKKAIKDLHIKLSSDKVLANTLSGGNQQKVVVAKWLARSSKVIIFDEPTRGIDVAAKVEIYNLMNELKKDGKVVLFVSSEMPEVMGISDRIIVMCNGKITKELITEETSQDEILKYATQF